MKLLACTLCLLLHSIETVDAQIGYTLHNLESLISGADLVVCATVIKTDLHEAIDDQRAWIDVTLAAEDTLKGPSQKSVTIAYEVFKGDERWEQFIKSKQQQLWFLTASQKVISGQSDEEIEVRTRHPYQTERAWPWIRLSEEVPGEKSYTRPPPPLFTMNFDLLLEREPILAAARSAIKNAPEKFSGYHSLRIPRQLAQRTGRSGDANVFIVPADHRLEALAIRMIQSPEIILQEDGETETTFSENKEAKQAWDEFSANLLRAEGVEALAPFESEENIELLKGLLDHPATVGRHGTEAREY
ncbi:MAG: hypothetical protein P1U85_21605 [Verrucomicrobiales bacterium]|nr:hypothetical protein [Verrucomicrobiales bacterium]